MLLRCGQEKVCLGKLSKPVVYNRESSIPTGVFPARCPNSLVRFDPERGKQVVGQAGWEDSDGHGIREKDGRRLCLSMVVGLPTRERHHAMPEVVQSN